ncbi:MAG: 4'-phosphopantetheinyl transferase superfamily protein [Clostridia bacterium]|nr:4'-phosphopantetheinyl transferase superfamily protein [Clostridia bacterium]
MIIKVDSIEKYSNTQFEEMYNLMSAERQEKCGRYVRENDRKLCILADYLTRQAVSEFLDIPAESVVILRDTRGKPYIENGGCFINYSHSGRFAAAVVSDKPCGIDIEEKGRKNISAAKRIATEKELGFIGDSPERFLTIWTLKEAHVKCTGEGIRNNLTEIEFDLSGGKPVSDIPGFEYETENTDDYVLAVCIKK